MQNIISLIFRYFLSLFPACAGVIPAANCERVVATSFPRMCGGDPRSMMITILILRFSPHVRG